MPIGYKVVEKYNGRYRSCCVVSSAVRYGIGFITERPYCCGPLAVFKKKEDAIRFRRLPFGQHVFKCKYTKSKDDKLWNITRRVWFELPIGTVFADTVELIEEVKVNVTE